MALKTITGKVQKAGAYPLPEPKEVNFGKGPKTVTHRLSLQMESGEWIAFGETDKDSFLVKDDDGNWQVLGVGSEVLIKYQENGKFRNAKKGNLTVISLVAGKKFEKGGQASKPNSGTQQSKSSNDINPATVGACLNLAIEVLGYTKEDFADEDKLKAAIAWHKGTFARVMSLYADVDAEDSKPPFETEEDVDMYNDDDI